MQTIKNAGGRLVSDLRDLADWIEAGAVQVLEIYTDAHIECDQLPTQSLSLHYAILPVRQNA